MPVACDGANAHAGLPPAKGRRTRPFRTHATQIAAWRKQLLENAGEIFESGNAGEQDAERRIRELQAKVGELTMERDFLSGALGRFSLPSAKR